MEQRLDRRLCNNAWRSKWDSVSAFTLPKVRSDHNPIVFQSNMNALSGAKPFRFLSIWCEHESFLATVEEAWISFGTISMTHKLRLLKKFLRNWNTNVFGNIFQAVENCRKRLGCHSTKDLYGRSK